MADRPQRRLRRPRGDGGRRRRLRSQRNHVSGALCRHRPARLCDGALADANAASELSLLAAIPASPGRELLGAAQNAARTWRLRRGIRVFSRRNRPSHPHQRRWRPHRAMPPRRRASQAGAERVARIHQLHAKLAAEPQEPRLFRPTQRAAPSQPLGSVARGGERRRGMAGRNRAPNRHGRAAARRSLAISRRGLAGYRGRDRGRPRAGAQADERRRAPRRADRFPAVSDAETGAAALSVPRHTGLSAGTERRHRAQYGRTRRRLGEARPLRACIYPRQGVAEPGCRGGRLGASPGALALRRAARSRPPAPDSAKPVGSFTIHVRGGHEARRDAARGSRLCPAVGLRADGVPARAALSPGLRVADDDGFLARFAARAAGRRRLDARARRAAAGAGALGARTRSPAARQQPRHRRGHRAPLRAGLRHRPDRVRPARRVGLGAGRARAPRTAW